MCPLHVWGPHVWGPHVWDPHLAMLAWLSGCILQVSPNQQERCNKDIGGGLYKITTMLKL